MAAKRAYNAGRYEEAARLYAVAAGQAKRVKDRDEAYFMRARMYLRLEQWSQAMAVLRELMKVSPRGPRTARAFFEYARITANHVDEAQGWRLRQQAVEHYPNHGAARLALSQVVRHTAETQGEEAARALLRRWLKLLAKSDAEQKVKYELALSLRRSGMLAKAREQLLRTAREHPYPKGNLTDDVLWHASQLAEELGDYRGAIAHLRELLASREIAQGGSYERPRFPAAQNRIAVLYRDRLGDLKAARRAFKATYTRHATSILADDAMWQEALLARQLGDAQGSCAVARDMPERYPSSRYLRCLHQLCSALEPDPKARPCPPYILRQLQPQPTITSP